MPCYHIVCSSQARSSLRSPSRTPSATPSPKAKPAVVRYSPFTLRLPVRCAAQQGLARNAGSRLACLSHDSESHWPMTGGRVARSCRALGSVAAPDGFRSCTTSSGAANRTRHRRSSLLSTLPSLLGISTQNVPAPCVGSRLRSSSTKSRRSSAGSALAQRRTCYCRKAQQVSTATRYESPMDLALSGPIKNGSIC
jgi:hypothetical protein